jgi:LuxR family transcriptional regulator, positive regulator of biofilm formation
MSQGERSIEIVGQNLLQNNLLSGYLKESLGIVCACQGSLAWLSSQKETETEERLTLIDCFHMQRDEVVSFLKSEPLGKMADRRLTLFNLSPGTSVELTALRCGIRGFFYLGEPLASLTKGIQALFNDEYWVSRKLLVAYLSTPNHSGEFAGHYPGLTSRESELVRLLVQGLSNQGIADRLFISLPTVKSHLSSIYRKINVASRVQAVCWAERAVLSPPPPEP